MKYPALAFLVLLLMTGPSFAHKVNVFAYVDGDAIVLEASFSKRQKVVNGKVTFRDSESGTVVHEAITDAQGHYSFRPDAAFLATGRGLDILLNAGEGHQDTWQVLPEELQGLARITSAQALPLSRPEANFGTLPPALQDTAAQAAMAIAPTANAATLDAAALEDLVGRVLDAKLAPIKQALIRQEDTDPKLQDIIGGLGWIAGLLGLVSYFRYRRPQS